MPRNKTSYTVGGGLFLEEKTARFEIKSVDKAQGIIKGYLSVFNNVDGSKDRVRPNAFKKTISDGLQRKSNRGKKFLWPLLWMHDPEKPIGGFIDAVEDTKGLLVTAQLDISTNEQGIPLNPLAMSVFSGFEMGYIDELSIGYKAIQKSYDNQGIRDLSEIQVFEGSAVTMLFAANELAQVDDVKSASAKRKPPMSLETKDFNDRYREQVIDDWLYSDFSNLTNALRGAIRDIFMIGDSPQIDVLDTILNDSPDNKIGFITALKAYVQKGIDLDVANYLSEQASGSGCNSVFDYMSRHDTLERKTGAVVSQANADRLSGHIDTLRTVADDMERYITGNPPFITDPGDADETAPNKDTSAKRHEPRHALKTQPPTSTDNGIDQLNEWLQSQLNQKAA